MSGAGAEPRLVARGLACGHRAGEPVLRSVALEVRGGERVVLVGASGSGKTTLLRTLLGLAPPLGGTAEVLGARLPARPPPGSVGYIPQGLGLVRHTSALRNVLLGTLPRVGAVRSLTADFPAACVEDAEDALAAVGLAGKAQARPVHLSGGERRRVAIARALVQRPRLLLADEILSELDVRTAAQVLDAVRALQGATGMGMLLVEHNLDVAWEVGDVVHVLGRGGVQATLVPARDRREALQEALAVGA